MLQLMESFDVFAPGDYAKRGWSAAFTGSGLGRFGVGQSMSIDVPTLKPTMFGDTSATVFGATGFKTALTSGEVTIFQGYDAGDAQFAITYQFGPNVFNLYRGDPSGTLVASSSAAPLAAGQWHFIEAKVVLHGSSSGAFVLHFNEITLASLTGLHTAATAHLLINAFGFGGGGGATWDDFACYDDAGDGPTSFLGDQRMDPIIPTSDGTHHDFSPSTGSVHYSLLDETTPSATDEVHTATSGNIDTFGMSDIPTGATITAIQTNISCFKDGAGSRTLGPVVRIGGVDYVGPAQAPLLSEAYLSQIYALSPATGVPFTRSELNAAELGFKVTA